MLSGVKLREFKNYKSALYNFKTTSSILIFENLICVNSGAK